VNIVDLISKFENHPALTGLLNGLKKGKFSSHLLQMHGSTPAVLCAMLFQKLQQDILIITNTEEEAEYLRNDVEQLITKTSQLFLYDSYKHPLKFDEVVSDKVQQRAETLSKLQDKKKPTITVTYLASIIEKVISGETLQENTYRIEEGAKLDMDFLIELLYHQGYEKVDFVYEAGSFAIRGGIIDIYSFGAQDPYRLELDDDLIENIRSFDTETQLSIQKVKWIKLLPNIQQQKVVNHKISLFEYIHKDTIICLDNGGLQLENLAQIIGENPHPIAETDREFKSHLYDYVKIEWGSNMLFPSSESYDLKQQPQPLFGKNIDMALNHLRELELKGNTTLLFAEQARQIERVMSIIKDKQKQINPIPVYHPLSAGFFDPSLKLAVYTEHQLFNRYYRYKSRRKNISKNTSLTIKELKELKPGDFVTHIDYGIGKFAGLQTLENKGKLQEVVRIVYKDNDQLFVSINSLHKISKFSGQDGKQPRVHKLGSGTWEKQKASTKRKVKDIARELIKLYAIRKAQPGFEFLPDNYLQHELEASFFYEDTPDQAKASEDVKQDMEKPVPMDRLVCGDVGFGKTEVAVRAAFKAVCNSKQVAILVPTTILAYQHYRTFSERMDGFPVNVDFINRFKNKKEQKETLEKVASGKTDILIGTHRLLSKDVTYKNLGLLVIDEEQKFGVAAKEKLRAIRANIDTLTLTATPIPRTLHFSLMGARDLSVINTAPQNRHPIETSVHVFNKSSIIDAIQREVSRGGQVFFVHNRVKDIDSIQALISQELPEIKSVIAHGQMDGNELENIMVRFIEHEFDVLISTSIIETGLDIPNGNTIIINNAHQFGLSDLHQLRGRVGRSNTKAYCLLLAPPLHSLSDDSRKRLRTIEEFNELGSGFQIAMRDLDIRGAGNLLGGEQSGFINDIGFDVYHKILDEAIRELKESEFRELFADTEIPFDAADCQIETEDEMLIPLYYVNNIAERLALYQQLAAISSENELQTFAQNLTDRFGEIPETAHRLLKAMRLKWKGKKLGFEKITLGNGYMKISLPSNQNSSFYSHESFSKLLTYIATHSQRFSLKQLQKGLQLTVASVRNDAQALQLLDEFDHLFFENNTNLNNKSTLSN